MIRIGISYVLTAIFTILLCSSLHAANSHASSPALSIYVDEKEHRISSESLLKSSHLKKLTTAYDPAYKRPMVFQAIPLYQIFDDLKIDTKERSGKTLLFSCLDGFSAPISIEKLLNRDSKNSIAYIAIEPSDAKWPPMKVGAPSAGPYYLIWENPKASRIGNEEWPQQLIAFKLKASLEVQFPNTVPAGDLPFTSEIMHGYRLFAQNCFMCHTMNGEGASEIGPDLNIPHNPTEYMTSKFLEILIRNPQSLRKWPQSKMSAFDKSILPEKDLSRILAYLKHMAKQKVKSVSTAQGPEHSSKPDSSK